MALSLTTLFTFSTNSSDSQDRVIAYAHGNCWADWDYNSLSEEWEATYTRFAYAGVYAPYGVSGWWEAYAYVDQNGKTKPITTYEFGVDDGIGKRVYTAQYWGDNASYGRSRGTIVGMGGAWTDSDDQSWGGYYSLP